MKPNSLEAVKEPKRGQASQAVQRSRNVHTVTPMSKRIFDIAFSFIGLTITLPIQLLLATLILIVEGRPILYRGKRVGRFGTPFYMLKFRSMVNNAEILGSGAIPADDPRVTRIGRFLRVTKLDELPQFVNILKGEMSFVGPRPELWKYSHTFTGRLREILRLRPGVTDWATIADINEGRLLRGALDPDSEYEQRIRPAKIKLQFKYINDASFLTDAKILTYTLVKLAFRRWIPSEVGDQEVLASGEQPDQLYCDLPSGGARAAGRDRILLSVPHMGGAESSYVARAFSSNWLSTVGPNINVFERGIMSRVGRPGVALSSGTAALHLGLRVLGIGPGDEVICPTLTFVATVNPVRYLGAEPVLLDSSPVTWGLDPGLLETVLRKRSKTNRMPRAVVVVHLYGQCADMDPIVDICGRYGVPLVEDAAEALGASYKGKPAGSFGEIAAFSFNGNKMITTTGGGMIVSSSESILEKVRFWSQQSRDPGIAYEHSEIGYNYRISNVLAGIGCGQLEVLDLRIKQRRAIAFRYRAAFSDLPGISLMPQAASGLHTNWLSCFLIEEKEFGCSRDQLISSLDAANIESRPVWKPMHLQPLYAGCERHGGEVAEGLFRRGICLPSSSSLSREDQLYVINQVRAAASLKPITKLHEEPVPVA
jgi:pyridoxal phosphate-dependent aminotransferase EpsN